MILRPFRRTALLSLVWLTACASAPPFSTVTEPSQRVRGIGFSVLPPAGASWVQGRDLGADTILFGKADADHARQGATVIASAVRLQARRPDLRSGDALRTEVVDAIRLGSQRFTLIGLNIATYDDADLRTHCARIEIVSEERDHPKFPGQVLVTTTYGKTCRSPASSVHLVQVTCSERRPYGSAALLDAALRRECDRTIDSLSFAE